MKTRTRDGAMAMKLSALGLAINRYMTEVGSWQEEARKEGASAHNLLYTDVGDLLHSALEKIDHAGVLMDPDQTDVAEYEEASFR
jgi:hypothetical protein